MKRSLKAAFAFVLISGVALAQASSQSTTTTTTTTSTAKTGNTKKSSGTKKGATSKSGATTGGATAQALQAHEQTLLDAFVKKQADVFRKDLSNDAVMVDETGVSDREKIITGIGSPDCAINSATATDAKVINLDRDSAVLYYTLKMDGKCGNNAVPGTVYASTVYSKRGTRWVPVFHQETLPRARGGM